MKKILAAALCLLLCCCCALSLAEGAQKEDYTTVNVNGAFNIRGVTPEGYHLEEMDKDAASMRALFMSDDPEKPVFVIVMAFMEDYADVERMNDMSDEEIRDLMDDDPSLSPEVKFMETEHGTKVMILRSANPEEDDFACFVTVYKGYEVALNLFPGNGGTLTDEQIALAMQFLSDLDFVPIV